MTPWRWAALWILVAVSLVVTGLALRWGLDRLPPRPPHPLETLEAKLDLLLKRPIVSVKMTPSTTSEEILERIAVALESLAGTNDTTPVPLHLKLDNTITAIMQDTTMQVPAARARRR